MHPLLKQVKDSVELFDLNNMICCREWFSIYELEGKLSNVFDMNDFVLIYYYRYLNDNSMFIPRINKSTLKISIKQSKLIYNNFAQNIIDNSICMIKFKSAEQLILAKTVFDFF